jgi:hypothetical protein
MVWCTGPTQLIRTLVCLHISTSDISCPTSATTVGTLEPSSATRSMVQILASLLEKGHCWLPLSLASDLPAIANLNDSSFFLCTDKRCFATYFPVKPVAPKTIKSKERRSDMCDLFYFENKRHRR